MSITPFKVDPYSQVNPHLDLNLLATKDLDPEAEQTLNSLLMLSEPDLSEEIRLIQETSQKALQRFGEQLSVLAEVNDQLRTQLIASNSLQKQQDDTSRAEIEAWKQRAELAEKTVKELQQKNESLIQQSKQEHIEAVKVKEQTTVIAEQIVKAQVGAIKQQIKNLDLEKITFRGHEFNLAAIHSMGIGSGPECSCHRDPGKRAQSYNTTVFVPPHDRSYYQLYYGECTVRTELAKALESYLIALKKISS